MGEHILAGIAGTAIVLGLIAFYFLPSLVARRRQAPNLSSIYVINFFLGWTVLGWAIALAMAVRDR